MMKILQAVSLSARGKRLPGNRRPKKIMRPKRWNDWLFIAAIFCFLIAPLCNAIIFIGFERPEYAALTKTYDTNNSRPGHFVPAGFIGIFRFFVTAAGMCTGILLALAGGIRIPRIGTSTRQLRDATWFMFIVALLACAGIALL